jgi:hypothetical protein
MKNAHGLVESAIIAERLNVRLMGKELAITASSAIDRPRNPNQTFLEHGFGHPQKVWVFE